MNLDELIQKAEEEGIKLGKNPARTIRYYIQMEILDRPEIKHEGKLRISIFNDQHLEQLRHIHLSKVHGYSLDEIKKTMRSYVYWGPHVREFMKPFLEAEKISDPDLFKEGNVVTRAEAAAFIAFFMEARKRGEANMDTLIQAFRDENGDTIFWPSYMEVLNGFDSENSKTS